MMKEKNIQKYKWVIYKEGDMNPINKSVPDKYFNHILRVC